MILIQQFEKGGYLHKIDLGNKYKYVGFSNRNFKKTSQLCFGDSNESLKKDCYAFITFDNGKCIEPLYSDQNNWIQNHFGKIKKL